MEIKVEASCVGCGKCVKDCAVGVLEMKALRLEGLLAVPALPGRVPRGRARGERSWSGRLPSALPDADPAAE